MKGNTSSVSGNRHERRGIKDPEEYYIELKDPKRIAKPLMDENERLTPEGRDLVTDLERLGYVVTIEG